MPSLYKLSQTDMQVDKHTAHVKTQIRINKSQQLPGTSSRGLFICDEVLMPDILIYTQKMLSELF